jgi:hypothetical protein
MAAKDSRLPFLCTYTVTADNPARIRTRKVNPVKGAFFVMDAGRVASKSTLLDSPFGVKPP